VQALVTALVLVVVTPLTGFSATVEASIRPLRSYTALTPMTRKDFDAELLALVEANPAMERHTRAKTIWTRMPMIVGDGGTLLMALDEGEHAEFLRRVGNRLAEGSLPAGGSSGVAIHRDMARARGMKIGDAFGRLLDPEEPAPGLFRVEGIVEGPARVGLADLANASDPDGVLARLESFEVVYAKPGRKEESDAYLHAATDAAGSPAFRVWDEALIRRRAASWTRNLPLLLNAVVGALTGLVVVLLHRIAFESRQDEFALWLALGHTRRRLVGKLALETAAQALVAWALGLALGYGFLALWDAWVLAPKAILIRFFDPYAIGLASALPILASAASAAALALRLRGMDPVAVIQRRNA
jgi:hypothetical protein